MKTAPAGAFSSLGEHQHDAPVRRLGGLLLGERVERGASDRACPRRRRAGSSLACARLRAATSAHSASDPAGHVQPAAHLEPGERRRGHAERPVQHRIHREPIDPARRDDVARLRVGLDGHGGRDPAADQHHRRRHSEQPVRGHGLHGPLHGAELVGDVLVEDARALLEILGAAHEGVDLAAGVEAGVRVGAAGRPRTSAPCRRCPAVVGAKPDQPTPATPTRSPMAPMYIEGCAVLRTRSGVAACGRTGARVSWAA